MLFVGRLRFSGISTSAIDNRYLFTGRCLDYDATLYHYRNRGYDPNLGTFVSRDPVGYLAGDENLYRYVSNGPATAADPTGTEAITATIAVTAAIAAAGALAADKALGGPVSSAIDDLADVGADAIRTGADVIGTAAQGAMEAAGAAAGAVSDWLWPESPPDATMCSRNPAQDRKLTPGDIKNLKDAGHDPHDLKGKGNASSRDLYKDAQGNVYVKPKDGAGEGNPTGINVNDL